MTPKEEQDRASSAIVRSIMADCKPNPAMPKGWVLDPDKEKVQYVLYIVAGLPAARVRSSDGTAWYWQVVGQPKAGNIESPARTAPDAAREAMWELHRVWTAALDTLQTSVIAATPS